MGRWLRAGRARRKSWSASSSFIEGLFLVGSGCAITAAIATAAGTLIDRAPAARTIMRGMALKPSLSLGALIEAANKVRNELDRGRLNAARRALSRHLVSRDTSELSASEVAGAAIESVAENLSDSIVAPLLAYRAGGLTAAYVYRMINTADAMLGYRTPELEWYGKPAARLDDITNFVPARITATLICCAARTGRGSSRDALTVSLRDARRTPSPNAGWPMAAMAGALGIRLTKRGQYELNELGRAPTAHDIKRSCMIALASAGLAAILVDLS
jgi:adenosylcobinamide-phosphate synthase